MPDQMKKGCLDGTFAERLRYLMTQYDETLASVSEACGVTPQAVHKWLKGGDLGYEVLRLLANHFQVSWIWLRYGPEAADMTGERRDLTPMNEERRRHFDDLIRRERLLTTALDAAGCGVWALDDSGTVLQLTPAAAQLLGVPGDESISLTRFFHLMCKEDAARVRSLIFQGKEAEEKRRILTTTFQLRKAGSTLAICGSSVLDSVGANVGLAGVLHELSAT